MKSKNKPLLQTYLIFFISLRSCLFHTFRKRIPSQNQLASLGSSLYSCCLPSDKKYCCSFNNLRMQSLLSIHYLGHSFLALEFFMHLHMESLFLTPVSSYTFMLSKPKSITSGFPKSWTKGSWDIPQKEPDVACTRKRNNYHSKEECQFNQFLFRHCSEKKSVLASQLQKCWGIRDYTLIRHFSVLRWPVSHSSQVKISYSTILKRSKQEFLHCFHLDSFLCTLAPQIQTQPKMDVTSFPLTHSQLTSDFIFFFPYSHN